MQLPVSTDLEDTTFLFINFAAGKVCSNTNMHCVPCRGLQRMPQRRSEIAEKHWIASELVPSLMEAGTESTIASSTAGLPEGRIAQASCYCASCATLVGRVCPCRALEATHLQHDKLAYCTHFAKKGCGTVGDRLEATLSGQI